MSSVPPPHERILQHVGLTEQGLRELEIWLLGRLGAGRGGLQYHKARHYGAHNVGDWLFVETLSTFVADVANARVQAGQTAMLFKADSHNAAGSGIILWSHDDVIDRDPVWQIYPGGLIYFLDGEQDLGYTEGGDILRYSGGGNIVFYTTDGLLNGAGDFQVVTTGSLDGDAGSVRIDASGGDDSGEVNTHAGTTITENLDASGATYVINDHLGSPLVTYTG